jgi:hypothetical protein
MEHTLRVPKEEQLQGPVPGGSYAPLPILFVVRS